MAYRQWQNLTTTDFDALDQGAAVAVLPIAATEQHGPHLPVGTDAMIAAGMLEALAGQLGDEPDILVMPVLSVGASLEHEAFAGTLSVPSAGLADQIVALAGGVRAAGTSKLVIVSSHGGNIAAMTDAALRCRAGMSMLAVNLTWARLGLPDGLVGDDERAFGVHGGFVETSLMLHFRPDLVRMDHARAFGSLQERLAGDCDLLRAYGADMEYHEDSDDYGFAKGLEYTAIYGDVAPLDRLGRTRNSIVITSAYNPVGAAMPTIS
mgnify:CR=1 FL=1